MKYAKCPDKDCIIEDCNHRKIHIEDGRCLNEAFICPMCEKVSFVANVIAHFKALTLKTIQCTILQNITQIIGYLGCLLLILAYILLNFSVVVINGYTYQIMNLIAAILLIISSWENKPIVVLNIFWSAIALYQILKIRGL